MRIAGKAGAVLADPCFGAAFKAGGEIWVLGAQCSYTGSETLGIELVDGECAVAALRAAGAADEPGACAMGRIGQGCVHNLHEFVVAEGQAHAGKDNGWDDRCHREEDAGDCRGVLCLPEADDEQDGIERGEGQRLLAY